MVAPPSCVSSLQPRENCAERVVVKYTLRYLFQVLVKSLQSTRSTPPIGLSVLSVRTVEKRPMHNCNYTVRQQSNDG